MKIFVFMYKFLLFYYLLQLFLKRNVYEQTRKMNKLSISNLYYSTFNLIDVCKILTGSLKCEDSSDMCESTKCKISILEVFWI